MENQDCSSGKRKCPSSGRGGEQETGPHWETVDKDKMGREPGIPQLPQESDTKAKLTEREVQEPFNSLSTGSSGW